MKGPLSKTKRRANFAQALSLGQTEKAARMVQSPEKFKQFQAAQKNAPIGTKNALKGTKDAPVTITKESEPFKKQHTSDSQYEKWRQWIERGSYDRDDVERLMQDAGQPLTDAQQSILDTFEADGVFGDVDVEEDFDLKRLTA